MFDNLVQFFKGLSANEDEACLFSDGDYRVAAAALLVHLVSVDGVVEEAEQKALRTLLKDRYALSDDETKALIALARERDNEAVDLYNFTSVLKRNLDEDGRAQIIEMMWELVLADGHIHEFEDNLVWRVAELLGVSRRDRIRLRQSVQAQQDDQ
ncbi:MAG: TerB family tellurite resistance protein [Cohaesibacter sp.]|nr:TerB family tellurite resistance protein [Cohaesibacter sp.]MCV6601608.1 TerB family tellurite resistance protein [Cohaesibacter sp.]